MKRITLVPALLALPLLLASMGSLGCVNPTAGDTSSTILYAYDDANQVILAWDDVNTIYNLGSGATAAQPDRIITGTPISNLHTLAWGGMVVDTSRNNLYLIDEQGNVVRVANASSQNGALTSYLQYTTFTLGSVSTNLTSSVFTQAGFDTSTDTLYVSETGSNNQCRIWVVPNPEQIAMYTQFTTSSYLQDTLYPDTGGTGVAAGAGACYGYFTGGDPETNLNNPTVSYSGARARLSSGGAFTPGQDVMIGPDTDLGDGSTTYGTLAFDTTLGYLYVARQTDTYAPVMMFTQSQFYTSGLDSAPQNVMGDLPGTLPDLRAIAHARIKDWLAGIDLGSTSTFSADGAGTTNLYLWKGASQFPASVQFAIPTVTGYANAPGIKALAMDGSN